MAMSGTLDEVLGKLYRLFIEGGINLDNAIRFLNLLKHENGDRVFGNEDVYRIVLMLKNAKEKEK